jgi:dihydroflavonol-4-reductase
MTWAVTGATGLLGNNLVRALVHDGVRVRVLVRGASEDEARARREIADLDGRIEVVAGDLDRPDALRACMAGAEVVVHAAAAVWIGRSRRAEMERINVEGTRAVCAAVPAGARLVHVSSVDALGLGTLAQPADEDVAPQAHEGGVPYVDTKRAADVVVRASGVEHVIVHPTLMFGPWDWKPSSGAMLLAVARGQGRLAPDGGNNFVHVSDVVAGIRAAARGASGRAWILGNENLTYRDAWARMARITGGAPPIATVPAALGHTVAWMLDGLHTLGLPEGQMNGAAVRMGFVPHYFDPARARAELGLPSTPVESAFSDAWEWFRASAAAAVRTRAPGHRARS